MLKDSLVIKKALFEALVHVLTASGKSHLATTLSKVFKGLLPVLLAIRRGTQSAAIPKNFLSVAEQASSFLKSIAQGRLCTSNPEVFEEKLFILLQHICTKVPEKTDHRTQGAQLLLTIFTLLTDVQRGKFAPWMRKFTKNSRASYRLFGTEVMGLLLQSQPLTEVTLEDEAPFFSDFSHIFQLLFARVHDKSPA